MKCSRLGAWLLPWILTATVNASDTTSFKTVNFEHESHVFATSVSPTVLFDVEVCSPKKIDAHVSITLLGKPPKLTEIPSGQCIRFTGHTVKIEKASLQDSLSKLRNSDVNFNALFKVHGTVVIP